MPVIDVILLYVVKILSPCTQHTYIENALICGAVLKILSQLSYILALDLKRLEENAGYTKGKGEFGSSDLFLASQMTVTRLQLPPQLISRICFHPENSSGVWSERFKESKSVFKNNQLCSLSTYPQLYNYVRKLL